MQKLIGDKHKVAYTQHQVCVNFCFIDGEISDDVEWHYICGGLAAHSPPPHSTEVKPGSAPAPPSLSQGCFSQLFHQSLLPGSSLPFLRALRQRH